MLARLASGTAVRTELLKLVVAVHGRSIWGLNDILLRNSDIRSTVRFSVTVNSEPLTDEVIGDGLVVATPFGSSAYFRSISNTTFRTGIGIAFNNCTDFGNHVVLRPEDRLVNFDRHLDRKSVIRRRLHNSVDRQVVRDTCACSFQKFS